MEDTINWTEQNNTINKDEYLIIILLFLLVISELQK